jgi:hypothetical protein
MNILQGYWHTLCQYGRTVKGRHDGCDYLRAVFLVLVTAMLLYLLLAAI